MVEGVRKEGRKASKHRVAISPFWIPNGPELRFLPALNPLYSGHILQLLYLLLGSHHLPALRKG